MIELDAAVVHRLGGHAQSEFEIGRIQAKAVAAGERKLPREKIAVFWVHAPPDASLEATERELRQIVGESRLDIGQNEICHQLTRLAVRELKPEAHRAGAALDGDGTRQPRPPGRDIRVVETCIQATADSAPVRERHSSDISAQLERRRKRRGWNTRQAEAVMTETVFKAEFDVLERQRCGGA